MPTALTLHIAPPHSTDGAQPGLSWRVLVEEDFDVVFGKVYPVTPPASNLEARQGVLYTTTDGRRITILQQAIVSIEEGVDE